MGSRFYQNHQAFHLKSRAPEPVPIEQLIETPASGPPTVIRRASPSTTSADVCTPNDSNSNCQKPSVANNISIPVSLGVVYALETET